jgi:hypothetical protein
MVPESVRWFAPTPMGRHVEVLELDDLHRRYGDVAALDGMTFTVPAARCSASWDPTERARRPRCAPCSA